MAIFAEGMTKEQMLGEAERLETLAARWRQDAAALVAMHAPTREVRKANLNQAAIHEGHAENAVKNAERYRTLAGRL